MNAIKYRTKTELEDVSLTFSEKFTILLKVIANPLNIVKTVNNIRLTALLIAITLLNSSSTYPPKDSKVDVVVIDPGHGGHDAGRTEGC